MAGVGGAETLLGGQHGSEYTAQLPCALTLGQRGKRLFLLQSLPCLLQAACGAHLATAVRLGNWAACDAIGLGCK